MNSAFDPRLLSRAHPQLGEGVRMHVDPLDGRPVMLFPEGVLRLNATGAAVLALCDGERSVAEIVAILAAEHAAPFEVVAADVCEYLARLCERQILRLPGRVVETAPQAGPGRSETRPLGLLAEVTHRCPLHCPYCSNPPRHPSGEELATSDWQRVFREAADLGVLHVLLSGGEPLLRADLVDLTAAAREAGLYVNLLTSGLGLTLDRAEELKAAGLDSVQISFQAEERDLADTIAGVPAHAAKRAAARLIRQLELPLTVNVVLHSGNIDRVEGIIALARELEAHRLELANVQFYGWAFRNRAALLPNAEQLRRAETVAGAARDRLRGRMEVLYVPSDQYGERPKACMHGWGQRYLTVNPVGDVLPCPTAAVIPGLRFENVRHRSLPWVWGESDAFNRFRGTAWLPEPCRSCDLREIDFGGCRCQAALLTGDAANPDPACGLSPHHELVSRQVEAGEVMVAAPKLLYRRNPPKPATAPKY
jgi:pyrroloquinoline quinone biosynthesis protein E